MNKEDYLNEFRAIADRLTNRYIEEFDNSDLERNEYINSIADNFKKELAEKGTEIFHKSLIQGVDDNLGLITGVQKINFDSVMKLRANILK